MVGLKSCTIPIEGLDNGCRRLFNREYRNLKAEGAQYFITTEQDKIDKDVINYLKSKYKTIRSTE